MNTTAVAGRKGLWAGLVMLVLGLGIVVEPGKAISATDAPITPTTSGAGSNIAFLEYTVARQPLATWGLTIHSVQKAFQREPDTAGRRICRGGLQFGNNSAEETVFVWDYTRGKLYLDLNHNRDLTDDPGGLLSCPVSRFSYYFQRFTNAQMQIESPRGMYPVCVDFTLYNPEGGHPSGTAACRSFWSGKITLGGSDYQVGHADAFANQLGLDNQGSLLLRPWDRRDEPWDLMNGSLDAFGYSQNLFFGGQAYRVDCSLVQQAGTRKFRISFRERPVELGELKLTGNCIERLVLSPKTADGKRVASSFTAVVDRPNTLVRIPVGEYQQWRVFLKSGNISAYNEQRYSNSQQPLRLVTNGAPAVLAAGAPLTNSVLVSGQGPSLSLSYRLLGGAGTSYQLATAGVRQPPRFAIYKEGKLIHSGRFEFG